MVSGWSDAMCPIDIYRINLAHALLAIIGIEAKTSVVFSFMGRFGNDSGGGQSECDIRKWKGKG